MYMYICLYVYMCMYLMFNIYISGPALAHVLGTPLSPSLFLGGRRAVPRNQRGDPCRPGMEIYRKPVGFYHSVLGFQKWG